MSDLSKTSVKSRLARHPWAGLAFLSFFLEILIESLHLHSFLGGFVLLLNNPLAFFWGMGAVWLTLSLGLLCKRRAFAVGLAAAAWLTVAIADCVVLFFRTTPLAAIDFALLPSIWTVLPTYLTPWQMVVIGLAAVCAVWCFARLYRRCRQMPRRLRDGAFLCLILVLALVLGWQLGLRTGDLAEHFPNLPQAYKEHGFTYCFTTSLLSHGIDEPPAYSEETVDQVLAAIRADEPTAQPDRRPNILFIQLESVMDMSRLAGVTINQDPTPTLNGLRESCSTGLLSVPSIGAGTANTEFEVLSGMNLLYFGTGEYPYKTILQDTTCPSLCYDLKAHGYATHAVHNHYGSFYDRNRVFANLGFDTFTSVEYMQDVGRTPLGWATDECLTENILAALDSTAGPDFVYAITVQAHGNYTIPEEERVALPYTVTSGVSPEERYEYAYYMTQLKGTDDFVRSLLTALEMRAEPCAVVLYGDHLPTLVIEGEALDRGGLLDSEYVIWSNFGLEKQDRDLQAYQLGAELLGRLDLSGSVVTKLHQRYRENPNYETALELLEYDLLYGEEYGGPSPAPTELQMGLTPVEIHYALDTEDGLLVLGEGFTSFSKVQVDGRKKETRFVNQYALLLPDWHPEDLCTLTVEMSGMDRLVLSVSNDYVMKPREEWQEPLPDIPILPED